MITPPPELVQQWTDEAWKGWRGNGTYERDLATQAAQWGADQELEACCRLLGSAAIIPPDGGKTLPENQLTARERIIKLRAARRPKPPSLKAEALESLHHLEAGCEPNIDLLRRALKALPE